MSGKLVDIWNQAQGFGKVAYPFRALSNLFAVALVIIHHIENDLPISYLEYFSIALIASISHVYFYIYAKKGGDIQVALRQLTYDFLALGWFIGIVNLSILPSFIFLLAIVVNYTSVEGFVKLHRLLLIPLACAVALALQGFEIHTGYGNIAGTVSLAYGTIHFLITAFVAFHFANRYQKGQKKLKLQKEEIEGQKEELSLQAQKLKTLNDSLQSLHDELENKVNRRAEQLHDKNQKLTEYAFINAHKLRAPVASLMGLVQFFDYDDHTEEQQQQIKNRLKESTIALEHTIADIRKKLEEEGLVTPDITDSATLHLNKETKERNSELNI